MNLAERLGTRELPTSVRAPLLEPRTRTEIKRNSKVVAFPKSFNMESEV